MNTLKLSIKDKTPGLYLYCNQCKAYYSDDTFNEKTNKCKCWSKNTLVYKAKIHIPGTKNKSRSKILQATNSQDALSQFWEFKSELIKSCYQKHLLVNERTTPYLVTDCMAIYIAFLRNEDVAIHKQKIRTEKHIREVERFFKYFLFAQIENEIDAAILRFDGINDNIVGNCHRYILTERNFKNKTYNKFMGVLRIFFNHINDTYNLRLKNPFNGISLKLAEPIVETITKKEFNSLLEIISEENGITYMPRTKEKKNLYKPWLISAFKLGLYTGRRREEIVKFKFSDIREDEFGNISYLECAHLKVDRAKGANEEAKTYVRISASKGLVSLLMDLGYKQNKGKDIFILAPEETMKRVTMMDLISKSFSHYYNQLGTGKKILFKHLRKTYISAAYKKYGEKARILTKSADLKVVEKNYTDFKVLLDANDEFNVFD